MNMVYMMCSEATWRKTRCKAKTYSWKVREQACECLVYALKVHALCYCSGFQTSLFSRGDKVKILRYLCLYAVDLFIATYLSNKQPSID